MILFYALLGALSIIVSKTLEVSIALIFLYTVLEIVTQGTFMPWPHIFQFEPPVDVVFYQTKLLLLFIITFILAFLVGPLFKKSGSSKRMNDK